MNEYFQLAIAFTALSIALFYLAFALHKKGKREKRRYAEEMVDREVKKWEAETAQRRAAGFSSN